MELTTEVATCCASHVGKPISAPLKTEAFWGWSLPFFMETIDCRGYWKNVSPSS